MQNDGRDPLVILLLAAILYVLLKQQSETQHMPVISSSSVSNLPVIQEDRTCPFCGWTSIAEGKANVARSLSAHMRQIHPREWQHLGTVGRG